MQEMLDLQRNISNQVIKGETGENSKTNHVLYVVIISS